MALHNHSTAFVQLGNRWFWNCSCGNSSNIGYEWRSQAVADSKMFRHNSEEK